MDADAASDGDGPQFAAGAEGADGLRRELQMRSDLFDCGYFR